MQITRADIALASRHEQVAFRRVDERLTLASRPAPAPAAAGAASARPSPPNPAAPTAPGPAAAPVTESVPAEASIEARWLTLARMIEALTGVRIEIRTWQIGAEGAEPPPAAGADPASPAASATPGWSLTYERTAVRYEHEQTLFVAQGSVQLADGRTLRFELGLAMQRQWLEREHVSLRLGEAALKDPLVLHFDGAAPALTDARFVFDLAADGRPKPMPFVGAGSGFLVWDRNANGRADDGSELFGAQTGNGFAELAALDADGNGWIDTADPRFAELLVWRKDALGHDHYHRLSEMGVAALYLGHVGSPFSLRGSGNEVLGQVRASGLYLRTDGAPGVMQQIDLSV